jgi:uncharacterized protein YbjT (DUF2867 family)
MPCGHLISNAALTYLPPLQIISCRLQFEVVLGVRDTSEEAIISALETFDDVELVKVDLLDRRTLPHALAGVDRVLTCMASTNMSRWKEGERHQFLRLPKALQGRGDLHPPSSSFPHPQPPLSLSI